MSFHDGRPVSLGAAAAAFFLGAAVFFVASALLLGLVAATVALLRGFDTRLESGLDSATGVGEADAEIASTGTGEGVRSDIEVEIDVLVVDNDRCQELEGRNAMVVGEGRVRFRNPALPLTHLWERGGVVPRDAKRVALITTSVSAELYFLAQPPDFAVRDPHLSTSR